MATYSTNEFKTGLKILIDGDPYAIVENEMVKPGKGQAFSRVKIRNLKNGRVVERTWKSGDSVEAADVVDVDMQYLYTDGEFWTFMLQDTFEQYIAGKAAMGDAAQWLKDGTTCIVTLWNGQPLSVAHGAPLRLRVERQLGYKQAKYVMRIELVERLDQIHGGKGGFWEDRGYEWYAGI